MLEDLARQLAGVADIALELDGADVALGGADHEDEAAVVLLGLAMYRGQDVAVGAIAGLQRLDDREQALARNRLADQIGVARPQARQVIDRDPLDPDIVDAHRRPRRHRLGRRGRRREQRQDLGRRLRHDLGHRRGQ